ncbi:Phospholipid-transporting ATPase ID [Liparis tanakae]|uniref:Phospholipid-transporting ATPase ID n=1 Tax=Liparis tanakae TaxID=230148 RepID=A0A4Z2ICX4_9TELE|nr:Phospholipid-transporting ATPase ID [Liparis tanakae]
MTIPKEIPEKWFPFVLPLKRKKQKGLNGAKSKKRCTEEERKVRANDREYNEKFQYALIPQISSLSWFTTIVPLALVLSITAVKDATDDYFRHKSDNQVNNRQSQVLIRGS